MLYFLLLHIVFDFWFLLLCFEQNYGAEKMGGFCTCFVKKDWYWPRLITGKNNHISTTIKMEILMQYMEFLIMKKVHWWYERAKLHNSNSNYNTQCHLTDAVVIATILTTLTNQTILHQLWWRLRWWNSGSFLSLLPCLQSL